MGFLSPLFLLGLGAIAVPVLLHLFRRETAPDVAFAAVRYLQPTRIERQERRRIQDWLLLLLRALALAVLAFAFARPYVVRALPEQPPVVVAVDTSYSMSGGDAMSRARAVVDEVLADVGAGTPVALVAFDDRAHVLAEPTTDHGGLAALVGTLEPGFGSTRYGAAIEAARGIFDGRPGRLVVVTDVQARGWVHGTASLPDNVTLEVMPVGTRVENLLVRDLTVQPDIATAVVSNAGTPDASPRVRLLRNDVEVASRTVTLPGNSSTDVDFPGAWAPGSYVVEVDDATGFAADNRRVFLFGDTPAVRVRMLVGDATERSSLFFLERAYAALGSGPALRFDIETAVGAEGLQATRAGGTDLAIWTSGTGIDRRQVSSLETFVRDGGRLLVVCGPSLDPRVADVVTRPFGVTLTMPSEARPTVPGGLLADDPRHPLIASLGEARVVLGRAQVTRACTMEAGAGAIVIARFSDGRSAIAEAQAGRGRLVVLATDLARQWNDLPVLPAFLPLVGETTAHIVGRRDLRHWTVADVRAAAYQRPGVWPLGPDERAVAVNVDVSESDQARLTDEEFLAAITRTAADTERVAAGHAVQTEQGQGLWRYGLMLLAATLVAEGIVARRPRQSVEVSA
jgi:hypothetical protein